MIWQIHLYQMYRKRRKIYCFLTFDANINWCNKNFLMRCKAPISWVRNIAAIVLAGKIHNCSAFYNLYFRQKPFITPNLTETTEAVNGCILLTIPFLHTMEVIFTFLLDLFLKEHGWFGIGFPSHHYIYEFSPINY